MALIKCPECGKENVSSTAKACPQCGFNVAEYYELNLQKNNADTYNVNSINDNNIENYNPTLAKFFEHGLGLLGLIFFGMTFLVHPFFLLLTIPTLFLSLWGHNKYDPKNFSEVMDCIDQKHQKRNYSPDCPVCHSHNTSKISMLSRSMSVELFGLASDTIGKQYVCLDCRHKW